MCTIVCAKGESMKKQQIFISLVFIILLGILSLYFLFPSDANDVHAVEDNMSSGSNIMNNSKNMSNNTTEKSVSISIPLKKPPFIKDV